MIPPKNWEHNPYLRDNNWNTVGMLLVYHCIYPPREWEHYPEL